MVRGRLLVISLFLVGIVSFPSSPVWAEESDLLGGDIPLTDSERAWIADHPVINVRISRSYPPFEFYADGRFQGLAVDYLNLIGERVGLRFQPTPDMPWKEALERLRNGNGVDLVLMITHTEERERYYNFTRDYISFPEVIFTRKDRVFVSEMADLEGLRVVTENDFISATQIRETVPGADLLEVDSTDKALRTVALGQADAYVGNLAVGSYLIDKLGLVNLKIAAPTAFAEDSYAMGVRKDWPFLVGILEKGLNSFLPEELQALKRKWFVIPFEHGLQTKDVVQWVVLTLLAVSILLILFMRRAGKMLRTSEERFRRIVEDQTEFIVRWRPDGTRTFVNDSYCRHFGQSRDKLIGTSFFPLISPDDRKVFEERVSSISPEAPVSHGEHKVLLPDGMIGWNAWTDRGIFDDSGRIIEYQSVGRDITANKLAAEKLEENEIYFRTLTQTSPDTIALASSTDGTVLDVNDAGLEQFGYRREDLEESKSTVQLGLWKDLSLRDKFLQRLTVEGKVDNFETELMLRDGTSFFGLISARHIDFRGEPCSVAYIKDITEQKRTEQQLRDSEARFRRVFEANPDFLVLMDLDTTRVIECNEASMGLFRMSREEVVGKPVTDLRVWQDESVRRAYMERLREEGHIKNFEATFCKADGETFPGLISARTLSLNGRNCYISVVKDVTVLKESEEALRTSEARYRRLSQEFEAVLEGITDSLVLFDADYKVVWANQGAGAQYATESRKLRGRSCKEIWDCLDSSVCQNCIRQVFDSGESFEIIRKTDDDRTWGVKGYPIKDKLGKVINVIQISSDLTEKIQLREEAARSAHLAALGSISAGIAHEINNPTGLVLMAMPMIQDAFEDILPLLDEIAEKDPDLMIAGLYYSAFRANVTETLEDIYGGAKRIKGIVRELKDFARENPDDLLEDVDMAEVIDKAVRLLRNQIRNSTSRFEVQTSERLPVLRGNAQRLEQVVLNLVHNACQALDSRDSAVRVSLGMTDNKEMIVLEVSDEGRGIPAELIEKVTDPFFTTRREEGGTGLGLSVTSRIVKEHDGRMNINSTPGEGTTFRVALPIRKGDDDE